MTLDTLKMVTGTDRFVGVKETDIGRVVVCKSYACYREADKEADT